LVRAGFSRFSAFMATIATQSLILTTSHKEKGAGCRSNEYLDYNMGFGALVVGHGHPAIVQRLREQLENSTLLGFEFQDADKYVRLL